MNALEQVARELKAGLKQQADIDASCHYPDCSVCSSYCRFKRALDIIELLISERR